MPRLVGKQSNSGLYVVLILLITVGVVGALEYFGVTQLLPGRYERNHQTEQIQ